MRTRKKIPKSGTAPTSPKLGYDSRPRVGVESTVRNLSSAMSLAISKAIPVQIMVM